MEQKETQYMFINVISKKQKSSCYKKDSQHVTVIIVNGIWNSKNQNKHTQQKIWKNQKPQEQERKQQKLT